MAREVVVHFNPLSLDKRLAPLRLQEVATGAPSTIVLMTDAASLTERLEHIGTQLDWVRDYL